MNRGGGEPDSQDCLKNDEIKYIMFEIISSMLGGNYSYGAAHELPNQTYINLLPTCKLELIERLTPVCR